MNLKNIEARCVKIPSRGRGSVLARKWAPLLSWPERLKFY